MAQQPERIAYVDGANLHKGIQSLGWRLDYLRFRSWLRQKYGVTTVKLFIGLIPARADLYSTLQEAGYQSLCHLISSTAQKMFVATEKNKRSDRLSG